MVLSVGYSFADERKGLTDPDRLAREENDWTSAQVARNAPRLIGFCSANPLREAALQELERCLGLPGMTGIKLHLGNSGISLRDPAHLARVQQVFSLANRRHAPVLVPGYPEQSDEVMAVFGAAAERKDPRMSKLYFDVATIVTGESTPADGAVVAKRIRQVGPSRVLYGSDLSPPGGSIRQGWEIFRTKVPLTAAELQQIANNQTGFTR